MYDDDIDDDDIVQDETAGPASGGYDAYRDVDDDDDEEEELPNPEDERRDEAEKTRGKDERAFYDGLAKAEDAKHDAMRKDYQKRQLVAGEIRQKLRHEQTAIDAITAKIALERERIDAEQRKKYRADAQNIVTDDTPPPVVTEGDVNAPEKDVDSPEFLIDLATSHIKQLEEEKETLERELKKKLEVLHEEERALSQIQYKLARM